MRRKVLLLFVLSALAMLTVGISVSWAAPLIELDGRYWFTSISGTVQVPESGAAIGKTNIDLKSDLDVRNKDVPDVRLIWHTGSSSWLRLSYAQLYYDGDSILPETVTFRGQTYTANTRVISSLHIKYASLGWAWQFINIKNILKFGTLLQAKGFWIDTSLNDTDLNINEKKSFAFGLPTVGAALDINPPIIPIDLFGEFSWMTAGKYGHLYDTEAGVKISPPIPFLSIVGGYRILDVKAKDDPNSASIRIKGPFAGATLSF